MEFSFLSSIRLYTVEKFCLKGYELINVAIDKKMCNHYEKEILWWIVLYNKNCVENIEFLSVFNNVKELLQSKYLLIISETF